MKISDCRRAKLYKAFQEPIIDLRIKKLKGDGINLDYQLSNLEYEIWMNILAALDIEE